MPWSVREDLRVLIAPLGTALLLAVALAGCGSAGGHSSEPVARVGNTTIDRAEVDHWASVISRGNSVGMALGQTSGTPRERALKFLISSAWVIGEAEERELSIANAAVERGLQKEIDEAPNGRSEFDEEIASTGQTLADVRLELKLTLAVARLRDAVVKRLPAVTRAEVASYYAHHRRKFYVPDRRLVDLIEQIHGYARAIALGRQLGPGARFAKLAIRELVGRESAAEAAGRMNGQLVHMIFAATSGRVAGPAMFNGGWVLGVVRKLIPAGIQPLSAVRVELSKTLATERKERALKQYTAAFVHKWTGRTSCSRGFVVQSCSEYRGARLAEENPLAGG